MYLVLTAMLALNISTEILNAFKTINRSIDRSNASIDRQNSEIYQEYDANMQEPTLRERIAPYYEKAKIVKAESEKLNKYFEEWKTKVVNFAGGMDDKGEIKKEGDIDASTTLLVEQGGGDDIKEKILASRKIMLDQLSPESRAAFDIQLPLRIDTPLRSDNNPGRDWTRGNFYNIPVMAAVTMFSKFQNDAKNSEALIIKRLFDEAQGKTIKFDAITAIAVTKTGYVLQGQPVEANIMLAAYNKTVNPQVSPSSGRIAAVKDGIAQWESTASGLGMQTVKGTLTVDLGDRKETQPWEFNYMVGTAGASLQLDKMNVLYIGVPNPVSVSAAGYSMEDVSLNIPGATLTKTGLGKYDVTVSQVANVNATINAQGKTVGTLPLRIKRIPDPVAEVGGKTGSFMMSASAFRAQPGIVAVLKNFDFDARFVVTSYEFSMQPKRGGDLVGPIPVTGPLFTGGEVGKLTPRAKPGDRIYLENIRAIGPDKTSRLLGNIIITLN